MTNYRIWESVNGSYVKLTIRPGRALKWEASWEDKDDGRSSFKSYRWAHGRRWSSDGIDGVIKDIDVSGIDDYGERYSWRELSVAPSGLLRSERNWFWDFMPYEDRRLLLPRFLTWCEVWWRVDSEDWDHLKYMDNELFTAKGDK